MRGAPEVAFDEGRRVERVVDRGRPERHDRVVHLRVVESWKRTENGLLGLPPRGVLECPSQRRERLVVDAHDRLPGCQALLRPRQFVVVDLPRRNVGQRVKPEDVLPGRIKTIRGDPAQHAAVGEAAGLAGCRARRRGQRILDERKEIAVIVDRLREVPLPLERGWHPEADHVVAGGPRLELLGVEEEQLVVAARLPDRTADRETPVPLPQRRLRIAVEDVGPAVGVPVRVAFDVVERAAILIGAALGDRGHLQAARPPVLGLITRREYLDLGDRLDVDGDHQTVAARLHRRHAVHHEVVGAAAG